MGDDVILGWLRSVVAATFEIDPGSVAEAATAAGVPGWSSLSHLILLTEIQKAFDIESPMVGAAAL